MLRSVLSCVVHMQAQSAKHKAMLQEEQDNFDRERTAMAAQDAEAAEALAVLDNFKLLKIALKNFVISENEYTCARVAEIWSAEFCLCDQT